MFKTKSSRSMIVILASVILLALTIIPALVIRASAAPPSSITLPTGQSTFSITLTANETNAFAGIEYGLKISDPSISFTFSRGDAIQNTIDSPSIEKDGVNYFGFYTTSNAYSGHVEVGTLDFAGYVGDGAATIEMVRVKIVRINDAVTESSDGEPFTVTVQRPGSSTPFPTSSPGSSSSPLSSPSSGSGDEESIDENTPTLTNLEFNEKLDSGATDFCSAQRDSVNRVM